MQLKWGREISLLLLVFSAALFDAGIDSLNAGIPGKGWPNWIPTRFQFPESTSPGFTEEVKLYCTYMESSVGEAGLYRDFSKAKSMVKQRPQFTDHFCFLCKIPRFINWHLQLGPEI